MMTQPSTNSARVFLDQTEDYYLVIDRFDSVESVKGRRVYGVINKRTDVVEAVGPGLPMAISTLYGMQADLDAARQYAQEVKSGAAETVIPPNARH